jgi:hypothetical protein
MKRQRGRGRKSGNPANRSYESNGPEVKIRGNASQIYDKYLQLARDATSAGDRVRAENLYQHAEHYYRIVQANQPKRDPNQDDNGDNAEASGDDEDNNDQSSGSGNDHGNNGRENRRGRGRQRQQPSQDKSSDKDDPLGVVTPEGEKRDDGDQKPDNGEEGESPRRRTRRPRRTKAEIAADKAAAEKALENASASADGGDNTGGDGPESQAA